MSKKAPTTRVRSQREWDRYWERRVKLGLNRSHAARHITKSPCIRCDAAPASCSGRLCYLCAQAVQRPPKTGACRTYSRV